MSTRRQESRRYLDLLEAVWEQSVRTDESIAEVGLDRITPILPELDLLATYDHEIKRGSTDFLIIRSLVNKLLKLSPRITHFGVKIPLEEQPSGIDSAFAIIEPEIDYDYFTAIGFWWTDCASGDIIERPKEPYRSQLEALNVPQRDHTH